ncbi:hypothetical protein F4802DRAFT_367218 [Xylaria palmicola]|nr:hypothetical protein F4802DRAFT_367218 [Xylaria palmicola]
MSHRNRNCRCILLFVASIASVLLEPPLKVQILSPPVNCRVPIGNTRRALPINAPDRLNPPPRLLSILLFSLDRQTVLCHT